MLKLEEILQEENCFVHQHAADWQDAIRLACAPMIKGGYCDEQYVDAIFASTAKYGPYYVLCENLALIHASNEKGVYGTQIAITVLDEAIKFKPDGYPVRVLVTLVAKDKNSHLAGIQAVSAVFTDPTKVEKLLDAASPAEVYALFTSTVTC